MGKIKELLIKNKEIILYLIFGVLTTVVSIVTFWLFCKFGVNELISNIISWIISVTFAFITNKIWVFEAKTNTKGKFLTQMFLFYSSRVVTLLVEEAIIAIFVTWLKMDSLLIKIIAQVIIIVLNYILSKIIVFRKEKTKKIDEVDKVDNNSQPAEEAKTEENI